MKVGLVLEGGAMRGLFTAGVLDIMLENNINVDGIIGVSAGALFGANYFSKQKGRVIRYSTRYANDKRYISALNLILTGNAVSKRFAYYKVQMKLDRFDNEQFMKENKQFIAVATDIESGMPTYFNITNPFEDMEKLRSSSAMPLASRIIKINAHKYLDGGVSDAIPFVKMQELGYDKIIIILTQPLGYQKRQVGKKKLAKMEKKYRHYPNFMHTVKTWYKNYNEQLKQIASLEKQGKCFVIRPNEKITVDLICRDCTKLEQIYQMGVDEAQKQIDKLKKYLEN